MKSMLALVYAFAALALLVAVTACNPYLVAQSPAPPGRSARLDSMDGFWGLKYYRMEISTGVAMALTCNRNGPCEHVKVVSDNPAIVEVRPASLGVLDKTYLGEAKTEAAIVVVGRAPGTAKLHLSAEEGERDVVVRVIPAPGAPGSADRPALLPGS